MSYLSSVLRLSTVGAPMLLIQLSKSFQSTLNPSIKRGGPALFVMSALKCLIILWKGSSSPSSGAINFYFIEATYA
jgi:hypothetical protein